MAIGYLNDGVGAYLGHTGTDKGHKRKGDVMDITREEVMEVNRRWEQNLRDNPDGFSSCVEAHCKMTVEENAAKGTDYFFRLLEEIKSESV